MKFSSPTVGQQIIIPQTEKFRSITISSFSDYKSKYPKNMS